MQVLLAVVDDLWMFAREFLFGVRPTTAAKLPPKELPAPTVETVEEFVETLTQTAQTASRSQLPVYSPALLNTGERYYIGSIDIYVYADPVVAFDNALEVLPYGAEVQLIQLQGRWAQIRYKDEIGWVFKDGLCAARSDVYPKFVPGEQYSPEHPEVVKLRSYIGDEFGGARGAFVLTSEEYVHYRLLVQKRVIGWGGARSRVAGTWQRKLKGVQGVYIRITPKTDAVMEYVVDDVGYLAYVEAVFPDNSIRISEVGTEEGPVYKERTLSADAWKELRPVFITVA